LKFLLEIILYVVIGLIVFFLGMHLAEQGLVKGSGSRLQEILHMFTSNAFTGLLSGMMVTAVIQSSSAVSVMVIGFVSAGVMTLYQGMGVILGANIGTTVTMHILALKVDSLQYWLIVVGVLVLVAGWFRRSRTWHCTGLVLLGFGLIFGGLALLQHGVEPLQYHSSILRLLMRCGDEPLLGVGAGMVFTAIIQSSSATSGIVLTLIRQGMLSMSGAVGIILGANMGTCVTALLAGLKATQLARRLAIFHILFNTYGVILFLPFLSQFSKLVTLLSLEPGRQIAIAHTVFNLITAFFILPFLHPLERMLHPKII
jgi:phosphate:Na+ symporter